MADTARLAHDGRRQRPQHPDARPAAEAPSAALVGGAEAAPAVVPGAPATLARPSAAPRSERASARLVEGDVRRAPDASSAARRRRRARRTLTRRPAAGDRAGLIAQRQPTAARPGGTGRQQPAPAGGAERAPAAGAGDARRWLARRPAASCVLELVDQHRRRRSEDAPAAIERSCGGPARSGGAPGRGLRRPRGERRRERRGADETRACRRGRRQARLGGSRSSASAPPPDRPSAKPRRTRRAARVVRDQRESVPRAVSGGSPSRAALVSRRRAAARAALSEPSAPTIWLAERRRLARERRERELCDLLAADEPATSATAAIAGRARRAAREQRLDRRVSNRSRTRDALDRRSFAHLRVDISKRGREEAD